MILWFLIGDSERKTTSSFKLNPDTTLGKKEAFGHRSTLYLCNTKNVSLQDKAASSRTHLTAVTATRKATLRLRSTKGSS